MITAFKVSESASNTLEIGTPAAGLSLGFHTLSAALENVIGHRKELICKD